MREIARLGRDVFDIRWVSSGIRVAVNSASPGCPTTQSQQVAITIGEAWVLNQERLKIFAPSVDF